MENLSFVLYFAGLIIWFIVLGYVTNRQIKLNEKKYSQPNRKLYEKK